jgi:hypothetical protein
MNPDNTQFDEFINQLISEQITAGRTISDEVRPYVVQDLRNRISEQVDRAVLDALPDEFFDKFEAEVQSGKPSAEALSKIVTDSGIDAGRIIAQTLVRFRELYLGNILKKQG